MSDPSPLPPGVELVDGAQYMRDAKGGLMPIEVVKPQRKIEDQTVRALFAKAEALSALMAKFKIEAFADIDAFSAILSDCYKVKAGGAKGNMTLATYDGLYQIKIQVADRLRFGPELHEAKLIVDECLRRWTAGTGPELRALIKDAFKQDHEGEVNRGKLIGLLQLDIADERWQMAMTALRDSMEVVSSARYIRFYWRTKATDRWNTLSLDMATL